MSPLKRLILARMQNGDEWCASRLSEEIGCSISGAGNATTMLALDGYLRVSRCVTGSHGGHAKNFYVRTAKSVDADDPEEIAANVKKLKHALTKVQKKIIRCLNARSEMTCSEIASEIGVTMDSARGSLNRMTKNGLLGKRSHSHGNQFLPSTYSLLTSKQLANENSDAPAPWWPAADRVIAQAMYAFCEVRT